MLLLFYKQKHIAKKYFIKVGTKKVHCNVLFFVPTFYKNFISKRGAIHCGKPSKTAYLSSKSPAEQAR